MILKGAVYDVIRCFYPPASGQWPGPPVHKRQRHKHNHKPTHKYSNNDDDGTNNGARHVANQAAVPRHLAGAVLTTSSLLELGRQGGRVCVCVCVCMCMCARVCVYAGERLRLACHSWLAEAGSPGDGPPCDP